jgi:DNA-binding NarL/FixJ family response regulator
VTTLADLAPHGVIADDQELDRAGFRPILTAHGIGVAGEAADGAEPRTAG